MLAMLMHPEMQERAQAEIDAVVGSDRLPNFDDRAQLPFGMFPLALVVLNDQVTDIYYVRIVEAIYKESLRWGAPVPLSERFPCVCFARRTSVDMAM